MPIQGLCSIESANAIPNDPAPAITTVRVLRPEARLMRKNNFTHERKLNNKAGQMSIQLPMTNREYVADTCKAKAIISRITNTEANDFKTVKAS